MEASLVLTGSPATVGQPPISQPTIAEQAQRRLEAEEPLARRVQWGYGDVRNEISNLERCIRREPNSILNRMEPLLSGLDYYFDAAGIFVQFNQTLLAPIWGSIRLLVLVLRSYAAYVDEVLAHLETLHRNMPRYSEYAGRYPSNKRLVDAVADALLVRTHSPVSGRRSGWD